MKTLGSAVLLSCLATSAQADYDDYDDDCRDEHVVVYRERGRTVIVEQPAPRVVVVEAPPPPLRRVLVRPEAPFVGAIWVEGYWRHTGVRFVWVRGHWIPPRYGYRFVQPRWEARRAHTRSAERVHGRHGAPVRHVRDARRGHQRSRPYARPDNVRDTGRVRAPVTRPRPNLRRQRSVVTRDVKRDRVRQIAAVYRDE